MNQYTPVWKNEKFPELNRKVTRREYEKVLDAAIELGIENGYFQEGETAEESFIPAFDYEGVHFQRFGEALRSIQEQLDAKTSTLSIQALTIPALQAVHLKQNSICCWS